MGPLAAIAILVITAGALASCARIAGIGPEKHALTGGGDGGGGGEDSSGTCPGPYPQQPVEEDGAGGEVEVVLAMRRIDFGDADPLRGVGLNLDAICSECNNCSGCKPPQLSCANNTSLDAKCDYQQGIDNVASKILADVRTLLDTDYFTSARHSAEIEAGQWTFLVHISGYNGQANDRQVNVSLYMSASFKPISGRTKPLWDGKDTWLVSSDSVVNRDVNQPKFSTTSGYVANGYFVAPIIVTTELAIPIAGSSLRLGLTNAGIVGKLLPAGRNEPSAFKIEDAQLGGIWTEEAVFTLLSSFRLPGGGRLCKEDIFYESARGMFCDARDISPANRPPSEPCQGISFGLGLTFEPALLGEVVDPPRPPPDDPTCPDGADPATDNCSR